VIGPTVLLAVFVVDNLGRLPAGVDDFLGARVTVKNVLLLVVFTGWWHLCCRTAGLYTEQVARRPGRVWTRVAAAAAVGTLVAAAFPLSSVSGAFKMELLAPFLLFAVAAMLASRRVLRWATVDSVSDTCRVLIVGTGPRARRVYDSLRDEYGPRMEVVGFVDSSPHSGPGSPNPLCSLDDLERLLMGQEVDEVVIALPVKSRYAEIQRAIQICEHVGVPVKYSASVFTHARVAPRVLSSASGGAMLSVPASSDSPLLLLKRIIDVVGAALGLLVLLPLFAAVAAAVKLTSPGPVLFAQTRLGRGRRPFRMYKFRSMVADAEARQVDVEQMNEAMGPIFKIRSDPRLTPIGGFLRRASLDELPQLWNVLRGQMSLVGPRPMTPRDVHLFSEAWLMRRFSVTPGLTGLWQVSGRSDLKFSEWIQLDLAYIDQWSLRLDCWILLRTVPAVLSGRGAS
jgi:exopolysaccharide biosynthesis polyprenyl glycosylphosphotransferase